jgi:tetratricopeptide (TPR) repeat protein
MASTSTIDDSTAAAIRRALSAAALNRLGEACEIGERALSEGADPGPIHAMLGMFRSRLGELPAAAEHLRAARRLRPQDGVVSANLAATLAAMGEYRDALEIASAEPSRSDESPRMLKMRGFLAQMLNDYPAAIDHYERVLTAVPDDWETWNNLGNSRREAGEYRESVEALRRASELEPRSAPIRLNFATALMMAGDFGEAEDQLRKMAQDFPGDSKPLRELHVILKQQLRDEEALETIQAAVDREPGDLELRLALASHLLAMLKHSAAEDAYGEVVKRDPGNALGNLGLGVLFEVTNRAEALSKLVEEAKARGVGGDAMNFIQALDHRRHKRFDAGLQVLAAVPEDLEPARRAHLLGQLEEGAGNYDRAFAAFERMNEVYRADLSEPEPRAANYRAMIRGQTEGLTVEWAKRWREVPVDDRPSPVFLVGFPRSGTTLLDTILMGHPHIHVLEEEPTLRRANALIPFEALPDATPDQVRAARDSYFEAAGTESSGGEGKLLIDKNPLSTNAVPWIRRLFPDARIILAIRHPCDVVLSCFVTNFRLNDGMASFLRLDTAAELYDLSFSYYERAQSLLNVPAHRITYESVIADRSAELRPLFDFLNIGWDDAVLEHETTARKRGHIKTASYAQVTEPIYERSVGRWRHYREHLEPVLPLLEPWIDKFGYSL